MAEITTVYCQQCKRANTSAANRCLWCGVPLIDSERLENFHSTQIEIGYLDGIERLDNPCPVRLVAGPAGLEVSELMPGSRVIKIAADALTGARVVDSSIVEEREKLRASWRWRLLLGRLALPGQKRPDTTKHDYILTISYKAAGEARNAVFQHQNRLGLTKVELFAGIINSIVRAKRTTFLGDED